MFKLSPQEIQEISQIVAKIMQDTQDRNRPHVTYVAPEKPETPLPEVHQALVDNGLVLEQMNRDLNRRILDLEGRLSAKDQALAQKNGRIQEICAQKEVMISALEGQVKDQTNIIDQKDERIRWLEKELREYQIKVDKDSTRIAELTRDRDHWKANHDNQTAIKAAVLDRPDLGERAAKVQAMQDRINELETKIQRDGSSLFWSALSKICDIVTPNRSWTPDGLVVAVQGQADRIAQKDERIRELEKAVAWVDPVTSPELVQGVKHLHSLAQPQPRFEGESMAWDEKSLPSNISYIANRLQALNNLASTIDPLAKQINELKTTITRQQNIGAQKEARICALENAMAQKDARLCALEGQVKDQTNVIAQREQEIQALVDNGKSLRTFRESFTNMQHQVYENAVAHGWHEYGDPTVKRSAVDILGVFLANVHAELSEAWEVVRRNFLEDSKHLPGHLAIVEELADVVIRIMDTCGAQHWDLADAIVKKHEYNKTRPHRHGGKQA